MTEFTKNCDEISVQIDQFQCISIKIPNQNK